MLGSCFNPGYPYSRRQWSIGLGVKHRFIDSDDNRKRQAANESNGSFYKGYKGMVIDNNDLDVPTFLRRKAD